jgi:hypothetical protein
MIKIIVGALWDTLKIHKKFLHCRCISISKKTLVYDIEI